MNDLEKAIGDALQKVVLPLNPEAAFEEAGAVLDFLPASPETDVTVEGKEYRSQVYRHYNQRSIQHIIYAPIGEWDKMVWFQRPNTPLDPDPEPEPVADYFVSTTGSDANDGLSLQKAWKTISKAASAMLADKIVLVEAGNYSERVKVSKSGSYLTHGPVTCRGFTVRADNVVIREFSITNTPDDANDGWGVNIIGAGCRVENNWVSSATRGGIILMPGSSGCLVANNMVQGCSQVGIEVHGSNSIIDDNEIWETIQRHPKWVNPPSWVDADGIRFFGTGHIFSRNYIHDITYGPQNPNPHIDGFQTWADEWHEAAKNVVIEDNLIDLLVSQAPNETGHGFMFEKSSGIIIRRNVVIASMGVETGGAGGGTNSNLTVVHNTFVSSLSFPYTGGVQLVGCVNSVVRDNIFYNIPSNYIGAVRITGAATGVKVDHNLYYRTDGGSHSAPVGEGDIRGKDPMFVDVSDQDFNLKSESPAIGAASDGGDIGAFDLGE